GLRRGAGLSASSVQHFAIAVSRQRAAMRSAIIFGVMKTSISCLLEVRALFLNRLPTPGKSPSKGTLASFSVSAHLLSLDVLGVDRNAGCRRFAAAVLGDVQVQNDAAFGRDLWGHLELQGCATERHGGGADRIGIVIM